MSYCPNCGIKLVCRTEHKWRHCARFVKVQRGAPMLQVRCESCGAASDAADAKPIVIKPCPTCNDDTLHYRADRYAELCQMDCGQLAELVYSMRHVLLAGR